jgi:aspartyl-tRNA synthetase
MAIAPLLSNFPAAQKQQYRGISSDSKYRGITSVEYKRVASENILKYFTSRQTTCGELRIDDVGKSVTLVGWLDSKKHGRFLQLKDGYGQTQIIIDSEDSLTRERVASVKDDSFVLARGRVIARPPSNQNNSSETGEIEVFVEEFRVLDPNEKFDESVYGLERRLSMEVETAIPEEPVISAPKSPQPKYNKYTCRTFNCGELNENNIGEEVILTGWLEFQRMRKFFTLRDGYGVTQVIIPEEMSDSCSIDSIPFESVLKVKGIVMARPPGMKNDSMQTGSIEVVLKSLEVLNEAAKNLPIEMRNHNRSKEALRMEYRYIDLRFADMQKNLRTRSKVLMKMREYLINQCGFIEVETPTLFRRTPGGAQEFVVPTRKAGKFYSLVQSPQQFKQMLMAGAIDRYFQIARCYRDEAVRTDRQPEFTQLDIELSFSDREHIMTLVEAILVNCWPESNGTLSTPFPKLTYQEAMEKYGSDKPDLRFDLPLQNVSNLVRLNDAFIEGISNFAAYAIVLKHPKSSISNVTKHSLKDLAKGLKSHLVVSKLAVVSISLKFR